MATDTKTKKSDEKCDDNNCPIHGSLKTRGQIIKGSVVRRDYLRPLKKFERYEKRSSRILAHNPGCINAATGDDVAIMECRPLSKSKTFVVVEKVK